MSDLSVVVREDSGLLVVDVLGELDVDRAPDLRAELEALSSGGASTVVIDLSRTAYIDSTGLGVLVAARKRAVQAGGELRLVCPEPALRKVFEITGVWEYFSIHETLVSALSGTSSAG